MLKKPRMMLAGEIRQKGDEYLFRGAWHPVGATLGMAILKQDEGSFRTRRRLRK